MKPISSDIVEKTWEKMEETPPQKAWEIIEVMRRQQPFVLAYLMAVGGDMFNQAERELLLYLGVVIWQIMSQGYLSERERI